MTDPFDLARFVDAQRDTFDAALAELRAGRKRTHWMWFVFPQLAGLGSSPNAQYYGLRGLDEARAFLAHPVLGPRLVACCEALLAVDPDRTAHDVLGSPDDLKLRSSATLFAAAAGDGPGAHAAFQRVLDRWYAGEPDPRTLALLRRGV